jgi:hypothetical protein
VTLKIEQKGNLSGPDVVGGGGEKKKMAAITSETDVKRTPTRDE